MGDVRLKVIVAGSRTINDYDTISKAIIESPFEVTEVVCGLAHGVDNLGAHWAHDNCVTVKYFPAQWNLYGKSAGYIRNTEMAKYADALIIVWDGKSKGSGHMLDIANKKSLPIHEVVVNE